MKKYIVCAVAFLLAACALEGKEYSVAAYNANGKQLNKKIEFDSNKAGIKVLCSSLCKNYPHATIRVHNNLTGMEVREYSPYRCHR
ncbi:hypothetical protein [Neisseria chenwenguii]|uniref:Uncharacterized protein n=1 Tax=Neisseria chenwenguii TaxID=1853278 RepID=A0A220RZX5_9NEIS|nr:hypothetical protein [Neisseria chenwenguii]ASK26666.1 hypothetical protein BG910_01925 [Neisseria chenwenguii]ROV56328.1 hypothetical protein EGS38_04735 [Neisseria chenwenguii]